MCSYYQDLLAAHADCGLLLREGREGDFAYAFPALAPWKVGGVARRGLRGIIHGLMTRMRSSNGFVLTFAGCVVVAKRL